MKTAKKSMFDIIKKQNGEAFAKAIRSYDNGIFDIPNIDRIVKYAGREAKLGLLEYLESLKGVIIKEESVNKNPIELLSMAGYNAYVADTLEKQNAIQKYFRRDERLCTFGDANRFKHYFIINAVRKDVDKIKRSDNPSRQDEYGTSVISIQVSAGFIRITNRYNHTVDNPDNTFGSDPDNIIIGLSESIKRFSGIDFSSKKVQLPPNYLMTPDNQILKYDTERNGVYFAKSFYYDIHEQKLVKLKNDDSEIMVQPVGVLNIHKHDFETLISPFDANFCVENAVVEAIDGKKIKVNKTKDGKIQNILADGEVVLTTKDGILEYINTPDAKKLYVEDCVCNDMRNVIDLQLFYPRFTEIPKFNPNAESIYIYAADLYGKEISFENVASLNLQQIGIDDSTKIKLNSKGNEITLKYVKGLSGALNFSDTKVVNLVGMDFLDVINFRATQELNITDCYIQKDLNVSKVKRLTLKDVRISDSSEMFINPNAKEINMESFEGKANFDFSKVKRLSLKSMEFVCHKTLKFNSKADTIVLEDIDGISGMLDFSHVKNLTLKCVDLSKVAHIKINPKPVYLQMTSVDILDGMNLNGMKLQKLSDFSGLSNIAIADSHVTISGIKLLGEVDFGDALYLDFSHVDFTDVKSIKFNPYCKVVQFYDVHNLSGNMDFSNVEHVFINMTDLSKVKNMKLNPEGLVEGVSKKDKLRFKKNEIITKIHNALFGSLKQKQ